MPFVPDSPTQKTQGRFVPDAKPPGVLKSLYSAAVRPVDQAIAAVPLMVADAAVAGKNLATGTRSELPSSRFEKWLDERTVAPSGAGKLAEAGSSMLLGMAAPGGALKGAETGLERAAVKVTPKLEEAKAAAQEYIDKHTSLKWEELPARMKAALVEMGKDAKSLLNLSPEDLERQARLSKLNLPATRGHVTRDLSQITREENLSRTDPTIRNIHAEQDRILHEHLDTLRGETGGKASTPGQVGQSVQGAARGKLDALRKDYQETYDRAKESGAGLDPADISPLKAWLASPTNKRNAGYLTKAIKDYEGRGEKGRFIPQGHVSINNLEEIRKEAAASARKPGPEGHFAKEATRVIDQILDRSGSNIYREARTKFKAVKDEFDRQGRVAALVKQKGMSRDRAVALEDTFDSVVRKGSNEQLQAVKQTLTTGGTAETRAKGEQAWKDLQGATIDYLKEAAAGKRGIQGEKGQLQFNSSFIEAVNELDKDGKLDTLFGPGTSARLRDITQAVRDVRTKPAGRIAGSDTVPRIINLLERLGRVPYIGTTLAGTGRMGRKVIEAGREAKAAARAARAPVEDVLPAEKRPRLMSARKIKKENERRRNLGYEDKATLAKIRLADESPQLLTLGSLGPAATGAVAGRYTLQDEQRQ